MSINGIGSAEYWAAGHQAGKAKRNAESGAKSFVETVAEKTAEADKVVKGHDATRVLNSIAEHAPEEVRQAFLEAEKETGGHFTVGGFWISNDGKEFQITQLAVDYIIRRYQGESNPTDLLGTSVGSAISAVKKWIYDLDHPLAGQPAGSAEDRKLIAMERAFYESFLEKLKKL